MTPDKEQTMGGEGWTDEELAEAIGFIVDMYQGNIHEGLQRPEMVMKAEAAARRLRGGGVERDTPGVFIPGDECNGMVGAAQWAHQQAEDCTHLKHDLRRIVERLQAGQVKWKESVRNSDPTPTSEKERVHKSERPPLTIEAEDRQTVPADPHTRAEGEKFTVRMLRELLEASREHITITPGTGHEDALEDAIRRLRADPDEGSEGRGRDDERRLLSMWLEAKDFYRGRYGATDEEAVTDFLEWVRDVVEDFQAGKYDGSPHDPRRPLYAPKEEGDGSR